MNKVLEEMFTCLRSGRDIYLPSKFWHDLNDRNIAQLQGSGTENLKRTVAQNYFTWVVGLRNDQFKFLAGQMCFADWQNVFCALPKFDASCGLSRLRFLQLCIFTRMLWRFAQRYDRLGLLKTLGEPLYGNPFPIYLEGKLISQDLANSVLELYSMLSVIPENFTANLTICELGAGYGRNAYVFLKAFPNCKYIIIDIPPALYVSQRYLQAVLPERKIASFQCATDASEIKARLEWADVIFLLPHQAELLADKSIDLFVNISSLHEMTTDQIMAYFGLIDQKTRGHFYTKQWKRFFNPKDQVTVAEKDYPYPSDWKRVLSRTALVQPAFFEAAYAVSS